MNDFIFFVIRGNNLTDEEVRLPKTEKKQGVDRK